MQRELRGECASGAARWGCCPWLRRRPGRHGAVATGPCAVCGAARSRARVRRARCARCGCATRDARRPRVCPRPRTCARVTLRGTSVRTRADPRHPGPPPSPRETRGRPPRLRGAGTRTRRSPEHRIDAHAPHARPQPRTRTHAKTRRAGRRAIPSARSNRCTLGPRARERPRLQRSPRQRTRDAPWQRTRDTQWQRTRGAPWCSRTRGRSSTEAKWSGSKSSTWCPRRAGRGSVRGGRVRRFRSRGQRAASRWTSK